MSTHVAQVSPEAVSQMAKLLPLDEQELHQILTYTTTLPAPDSKLHLQQLLGETPESQSFIDAFTSGDSKHDVKGAPAQPDPHNATGSSEKASMQTNGHSQTSKSNGDSKTTAPPPDYAPPQGQTSGFAPPPGQPPSANRLRHREHTNAVIEAAKIRAKDEQDMQNQLQALQYQYNIYNADIEPEHETDYPCSCDIHQYQWRKYNRYPVQDKWSQAVMYPGEKAYTDSYMNPRSVSIFSSNPYRYKVVSPYGYNRFQQWGPSRPIAGYHAQALHQTIRLNAELNREAQAKINAREPTHSIWQDDALEAAMSKLAMGDRKTKASEKPPIPGSSNEKSFPDEKRKSSMLPSDSQNRPKASKMSSFRKSLGFKSTEEKMVIKAHKNVGFGQALRDQIETEENGRWPDEQWRYIVAVYQEKVGMSKMIADLRANKPIQYLHLLRAGYFEPIPVAWATQASNPLKFSIESTAGWRGLTPAWRGYEDTAEERLYWVLNHREGSVGMRMKPDFISEMQMARDRMATAVEPPPLYFDSGDQCHVQHTSSGYSKQVMPSPFRPADRPEVPTDDTMVLLDVSGSMDFDPVRPDYDQYLITRWSRSTQPKNKDVAKAITRRFTDAMAHHDHMSAGYDLITFSTTARVIGTINHKNFESMWRNVRLGGGTRVMTGWQKCKELHFQKHSESATYHPVYGWQAGPQTPILRLLLLLDGEATDMDEFELDLLGLSWAHVTIFLIGVDGCPHHHRHANELQRISDVNHHVSFVDAQGNCPERFVTHELLKRHLGYDISMREFEEMEELPAYRE